MIPAFSRNQHLRNKFDKLGFQNNNKKYTLKSDHTNSYINSFFDAYTKIRIGLILRCRVDFSFISF